MYQILSLLTAVDTLLFAMTVHVVLVVAYICALVDSKHTVVQIETEPDIELAAFDLILSDTKLH